MPKALQRALNSCFCFNAWSILIVPRRYWAGTFSPFSKGWGTIFFVSGHALTISWRSKNNLSRCKSVSFLWLNLQGLEILTLISMPIARLRRFGISGETFKDRAILYFDFGIIWFQIALLFWGVTWDEEVPFLHDFSSENLIYFFSQFLLNVFQLPLHWSGEFLCSCLLYFLSFQALLTFPLSFFLSVSFCFFWVFSPPRTIFLQPLASFLNCTFS